MTIKTGMSTRIPKKTVILTAAGLRLRSERVGMMLKQEEFGALAGVTRNSQALYEAGKSPFGIDYLFRLSAHGVDIGYIVTGLRGNGIAGHLEQSFMQYFSDLTDDQKGAILHLLGVMLGKPPLSADDLTSHSSQTMHSGRLEYRPLSKDK